MITVLDIETTRSELPNGKFNPMPYLATNTLVSVGYRSKWLKRPLGYCFFDHPDNTQDVLANHLEIQEVLDNTTLLVGHNIKFDLQWLKEAGFNYEGRVYDTMIFEYLKQKGSKQPLGLGDIAARRNLPAKGDILKEYFKAGKNTTDVPMDLLEEYGRSDVDITWALFWEQVREAKENPELSRTINQIRLSNDACYVLTEMERNGCAIDLLVLEEIEKEYREELDRLDRVLMDICLEVMGHTKINLNSSEHLSWVVYSRRVLDKNKWAEVFNIGAEERNAVKKKKMAARMSDSQFKMHINSLSEKLVKTSVEQCGTCEGSGYVQLYKMNGDPCKRKNICKTCDKKGYVFINRTEYAGLKLKPKATTWCSAGGFKTDGDTIEELLKDNLSDTARMFLEAVSRRNSISTYLTSFVEGIKNGTINGLLHTNFNQCITATGRLSSSNPNLQNMPRDKTFPIRKTVKSRFDGGKIIEADWSQLEFRIAGLLSGCPKLLQFIKEGKDAHAVSAEFFGIERQEAKAETFAPLYGKITKYTDHFYTLFPGIKEWHARLMNDVVRDKQTLTPCERYYSFPFAQRLVDGLVAGHTQIKNYSVQGFGWDIMAMAMIDIFWRMKALKLKSMLILTVHDSLLADCYPGEEAQVKQCFEEGFGNITNILKQRFNIDNIVPFDFEIGMGENWGNCKK